MPHYLKLTTAFALAFTLAACASTYDKPSVGMDDSDAAVLVAETVESKEEPVAVILNEGRGEMPTPVMVGGAAMTADKTIVENASAADNLTTLVTLVKQAELVETLSGPGPFTVFAPTDAAFSVLPAATRDSLMLDENRAQLQNILTNHVIASKLTAGDLIFNIERNGGAYSTTTVAGTSLDFFIVDGKVKIADANGLVSTVTTADVLQSNGVVHVVSSVLMPK
ncbi:fasciclin domain-containing protein [Litorimonas sp. WD9-15]|uniref:fasciclin domain-containing protein n=1 Tax=Litorimonas sp. WD9-15 TaxID=3418716 RepID=UPI003D08A372